MGFTYTKFELSNSGEFAMTTLGATGILAGIGAVGDIAQMHEQQEAELAQENRLDLKSKERQLQYNQKISQNYHHLREVLGKQEAAASSRGYQLSSPSFNAIQRHTMGEAAKKRHNMSLENQINQANINMERHNARNKLRQQDIASSFNLIKNAGATIEKLPTLGSD